MDADGGGRRMLVRSKKLASEIVWSPDSRTIAFAQGDGKDAEIFVLNRDGSRLRNLTDNTGARSEEPTSELQSLMRISYAVFCLQNKNQQHRQTHQNATN